MFSALLIDPSDSVVGQLAAIKGPILLFLFYPIANIVLWALNKKSTGNRSYIFVHKSDKARKSADCVAYFW